MIDILMYILACAGVAVIGAVIVILFMLLTIGGQMTDRKPIEPKVLKVYPTKVWAEKNFFGTVEIKMQHEGDKPFTFIEMHYNHRYTSNGHQAAVTQHLLKILGATDEQPDSDEGTVDNK
jgi:hypothetical protein